MRNLTREIRDVAVVENGRDTIPLPRDYAYVDLMVELQAKITIAGGNTSGTLLDVAPAQLIRTIEVRANGRDVIKSMDYEGLVRLTHLRYGTAPDNTLLASGDAQVNTECFVYAIIPQAMWHAVKPFDTIFNAKPLSTYEMILTFGACANIYQTGAAGNRTTTLVEGRVYVSCRESVGIPADQVFPINKEGTLEDEITANATEFKIPLNYAKDLSYRALVLRSTDGYQVVNTVINEVQLKSGGVIFFKLAGRRVRARYKSIYWLESIPTGYYPVDFCEDGRLGDSLDTSGLSSLDLILNVTVGAGTTRVKCYTTEIIVPTVVT